MTVSAVSGMWLRLSSSPSRQYLKGREERSGGKRGKKLDGMLRGGEGWGLRTNLGNSLGVNDSSHSDRLSSE